MVLSMQGCALVKLHDGVVDDDDYILFVYIAFSLPKCFPTSYLVVWYLAKYRDIDDYAV